MADTDIFKVTWHRASHMGRKTGKLHLPVELLDGGYRAACNKSILLQSETYPASRLGQQQANGMICTSCVVRLTRETKCTA